MQTKYQQLQNFLFELVDIQIKKYMALTKIGVGPDALLNAQLVKDEVDILLGIISKINVLLLTGLVSPENFWQLFHTVKFYLDQEYIRSHAAWLVDENHIHNPLFDRLKQQRSQLESIIKGMEALDIPSFLDPSDYRRCEYDSNAIAFKILTLAIKLKENPNTEIGNDAPEHAKKILKKHAQPEGRYHNSEIFNNIQQLHIETQNTLSTLKNLGCKPSNEKSLSPIDETQKEQHREQFSALMDQYRKLNPRSHIFDKNKEWYAIGNKERNSQPKTSASQPQISRFALFTCATGALAVAAAAKFVYEYQPRQ